MLRCLIRIHTTKAALQISGIPWKVSCCSIPSDSLCPTWASLERKWRCWRGSREARKRRASLRRHRGWRLEENLGFSEQNNELIEPVQQVLDLVNLAKPWVTVKEMRKYDDQSTHIWLSAGPFGRGWKRVVLFRDLKNTMWLWQRVLLIMVMRAQVPVLFGL